MTDDDIDKILKRAAQVPYDMDSELLDRVAASIEPLMGPVRARHATGVLVGWLVLIATTVAVAGAAIAGFHGIQKMSAWQRAFIFPTLAICIVLTAWTLVSEIIPGSRRRLSPVGLLGIVNGMLLAIFAVLFRDYHTEHFLHQGIICLMIGLAYAIPTAFGSWLLLRRGFAVDPVAAGLAAGTLAGLAGVTMLELHCPNFQALHLLLWHTAVILVSAGAGAILPRLAHSEGH